MPSPSGTRAAGAGGCRVPRWLAAHSRERPELIACFWPPQLHSADSAGLWGRAGSCSSTRSRGGRSSGVVQQCLHLCPSWGSWWRRGVLYFRKQLGHTGDIVYRLSFPWCFITKDYGMKSHSVPLLPTHSPTL